MKPSFRPAWITRFRIAGHANRFFEGIGDDPGFLLINLHDPHTPYHQRVAGVPADPVRPGEVDRFDFLPPGVGFDRDAAAAYYNGVARVDAAFGRVVATLKRRGLYDDAVIVFTSDHGPPFGQRGKGACYEAGLRVPLLAKLPGTAPGTVIEPPVSVIDLFPTVARAAGVKAPAARPGVPLQEVRPDGPWPHDAIYGEFTYHVHEMLKPIRPIRSGRWKLICNPLSSHYAELLDDWQLTDPRRDVSWPQANYRAYAQRPTYELYDLEADPYEFHNLADDPAPAEPQARLLRQLQRWQRETGDLFVVGDDSDALRARGAGMLRRVFGY